MCDVDDSDPAYVTVAERRIKAEKNMQKLRQQGYVIEPIEAFSSNKIAKSFWGHAWCRHLEAFSDFESRLPRGRSYVRSGSVCHLAISSGRIEAFVSGSELYEVVIGIDALPGEKWKAIKRQCSGKIGTLIELLQGRLSDEVMTVVTDLDQGLFPSPKEIHLDCNCPDYATLCKHLAAVLYGVGTRLDTQPELLFLLRGLNHNELIETNLNATIATKGSKSSRRRISTDAAAGLFGVDIDAGPSAVTASTDPISVASATQPAESPVKPRPKPPSRPRSKTPLRKASPITGHDIFRLRRKFGMSEWEFGLIAEVSSVTIRNWEAQGKSPHNAQRLNQEILDTIAQLSKSQARERLDQYL